MKTVLMPAELTAENGAKALLIGEFHESIQIENDEYCGCGTCNFCREFPDEPETFTQKVPVTWTTIKAIYKMAVDGLALKENNK